MPIIINYDSIGRKLGKTYRDILSNTQFFNNYKLILEYKNHNNIQKLLLNSKINVNKNNNIKNNTVFHSKRCNNSNCKACNYMIETTYFISNVTKRRYNLLNNFNCKTKNSIY